MFFSGTFCQRAVTTESVLRAAIERHYGVRFASPPISSMSVEPQRTSRSDTTQPRISGPREPPDDKPVLLTKVKRSEATPLPAPLPIGDTIEEEEEEEEPILLDRPIRDERKVPTLTGLPAVAVPDPPLAQLRATVSRDEIAAVLLDYIGAMTPRSAFFAMRQGALAGIDGRGGGLDVGSVKRMVIAVDAPSLFRDVIRSRLPYRGPLPETPANRAFAHMLNAPKEGEVLLLPIPLRDRVIAVVYADGLASALPDAALHAVGREAGLAYERLILGTKGGR
jgi:hypothetical protein